PDRGVVRAGGHHSAAGQEAERVGRFAVQGQRLPDAVMGVEVVDEHRRGAALPCGTNCLPGRYCDALTVGADGCQRVPAGVGHGVYDLAGPGIPQDGVIAVAERHGHAVVRQVTDSAIEGGTQRLVTAGVPYSRGLFAATSISWVDLAGDEQP